MKILDVVLLPLVGAGAVGCAGGGPGCPPAVLCAPTPIVIDCNVEIGTREVWWTCQVADDECRFNVEVYSCPGGFELEEFDPASSRCMKLREYMGREAGVVVPSADVVLLRGTTSSECVSGPALMTRPGTVEIRESDLLGDLELLQLEERLAGLGQGYAGHELETQSIDGWAVNWPRPPPAELVAVHRRPGPLE